MLSNQTGRESMTRNEYDAIRITIRETFAKMGFGPYLDVMAMTDEIFVRTFKSRLEIVEEYASAGQLLPDCYKWHKWEYQYASLFMFKFMELRRVNGLT